MIPTVHLLQRRLASRPSPRLVLPLALASIAAAVAGLALAIMR